MRDFTRAAKKRVDADEGPDIITIGSKDDPKEIGIYPPSPSQLAVLMGAIHGFGASGSEQTATLINYFYALLREEDKEVVRGCLLDRSYPFEVEDIMAIFEGMAEEWSGRPTASSSASSGSRTSTGRKSTANTRKKASTRST